MTLTRRHALLAGAALPLIGAPRAALAQAEDHAGAAPSGVTPFRAFQLGEAKLVTLLAGSMPQEDPHSIFGLDVNQATFEEVSAENFIPADRAQGFMVPALLDTGEARILFDTGISPEGLLAALEASGYGPGDVTDVVLTHMHPDHIGGLTSGGAPTFADAAHHAGRVEFDFWAGQGNEAFEASVRPLADRLAFIEGEGEVLPGVAAVETFGHTPGHLSFRVESGGERVLILGDVANHYVWSLGHPDWEVLYDNDKVAAAATRRRVLGMLAQERMAAQGFHLPFPSLGFVQAEGEGFAWVPVSYQFTPAA